MDQHKFSMFQQVYVKDDPTNYGDDSRCWYITGINVKYGYDFVDWQYTVTQGYYSDCSYRSFGGKTDVSSKIVRPEQLMTVQEFEESQQESLLNEIEQYKQKISALEARLAKP